MVTFYPRRLLKWFIIIIIIIIVSGTIAFGHREPGPHWWEASAVTTAPSQLPLKFLLIPLTRVTATSSSIESLGFVLNRRFAKQNPSDTIELIATKLTFHP